MSEGTVVELNHEGYEEELKSADADVPYVIFPEREKKTITIMFTAKELPVTITDREALAIAQIIRDQIQSWL